MQYAQSTKCKYKHKHNHKHTGREWRDWIRRCTDDGEQDKCGHRPGQGQDRRLPRQGGGAARGCRANLGGVGGEDHGAILTRAACVEGQRLGGAVFQRVWGRVMVVPVSNAELRKTFERQLEWLWPVPTMVSAAGRKVALHAHITNQPPLVFKDGPLGSRLGFHVGFAVHAYLPNAEFATIKSAIAGRIAGHRNPVVF